MNVRCFEKCLQKLSPLTPSTLTRERSSARYPGVTGLTVHRRCQCILEGSFTTFKSSMWVKK
eukprot:4790606-Pyramimonas_sp.AAC.1